MGDTDIFIYPPYRFRIVDALITNFHLPRSTLLMLVSALRRARAHPPGVCRGDSGALSLLLFRRRDADPVMAVARILLTCIQVGEEASYGT